MGAREADGKGQRCAGEGAVEVLVWPIMWWPKGCTTRDLCSGKARAGCKTMTVWLIAGYRYLSNLHRLCVRRRCRAATVLL
jgi:hypothetical protein